jgi:hypothetical protein
VTYFDPICFDMSRRLDPPPRSSPLPGLLLDRGEKTAGLLPKPDLPFELLDQSTHRGSMFRDVLAHDLLCLHLNPLVRTEY